ncbi:semaphorin-2A-like [Mercenaria mercenaria]|uniref:semaphorin-2A-like n=1 Tax=Mercenaria mercenaria TaxID=6596 RepID=UPI00234EE2A3|nr:semaphorin-2A-like [Mercenaria mercenaria]
MEMNDYLLVCGTGGFAPIRYHLNPDFFADESDNFQINNTFPGAAYCPFDPWDNYTAILVTQGNPGNTTVPYFGTYTDFIKSSPVISRPKFTGSDGKIYSSTSTDREDISWLNSPQFVGSFDDEEKVLFFFRETSVEYTFSKNKIFSRVGKVCKQDLGNRVQGLDIVLWLSFQKARLLCSGFDDIYGVYQTGDQFYALFYKHGEYRGDLGVSAICVYRKSDIEEVFAGKFLQRVDGNWVTVPETNKQDPRLLMRNCTLHRDNPQIFKNNASAYHLMAEGVEPVYGEPIYYKAGVQFINIAVSDTITKSQITGKNIFLASDEGEVYSLFMKTSDATSYMIEKNPVVYRPFGPDKNRRNAIWNMKFLDQSLVLGTDYEVKRLTIKNLCEQIQEMNVCILNTMCKWNRCNGGSCVKADAIVTCGSSSFDWTMIDNEDVIISIKNEITEQDENMSSIGDVKAVDGLYITLPFKARIYTDSVMWLKETICSGRNVLENPDKFAISSSYDLIVKNVTKEMDNESKYSVCYMGEQKIKLKGYNIQVASDEKKIIDVWKQQFNEWSSAFVKWKGCANSYYESCSSDGG